MTSADRMGFVGFLKRCMWVVIKNEHIYFVLPKSFCNFAH